MPKFVYGLSLILTRYVVLNATNKYILSHIREYTTEIFFLFFTRIVTEENPGGVKMKKNYTIGLDIGTASVGWAVLTEDYELIKRKMKISGNTQKKAVKKNFWGVRLFEQGETAEGRRLKRTTRRRIARRRQRIQYLRTIFDEGMNQVDANFFARLDESFSIIDEKENERHPIFGNVAEEVAYHEQFPTIYHLREHLANSSEQADLRLVYLALAHIIKFRGHFLIEGELNTENSSVSGTFEQFIKVYNETFNVEKALDLTVDLDGIAEQKISRMKRAELILSLFPEEKSTGDFAQFIKMIVGNQGNVKKTFSLNEDAKIQFSKEEYEENLETLLAEIGEDFRSVFDAAKSVYDAISLANILKVTDATTRAKLSSSMVVRFTDHKEDLKTLKRFVRENLPDEYDDLFKNKKVAGYAGYIDGNETQEAFYKYLKKTLAKATGAEGFLAKMEQEDFLRKQRTFDNGVIPYQLHLEELKAIIKNQKSYYSFLDEEKISQLMTFRIPYYVGPLAKEKGQFAWLTRKEMGKITPWNLNEKVDIEKSATDFVERMTNNDSYLPMEKVLPKHSLLYETFTVYNELTKVRYIDDNGRAQNFSSKEKRQIVNELFKQQRKVKKEMLEAFLKNEYGIENPKVEGIEKSFNACLGTYHDLIKLGIRPELFEQPEHEQQFEQIVKILTVFEDRKMRREQLEKFSNILTEEEQKQLERKHYKGWGRLSAKLIHGIVDQKTQKTILDYLIDDDDLPKNRNRNFMQLINDENLSFKEEIEKIAFDNDKSTEEIVQELAGSPAIKKGILQSLKIVEEIIDIMGELPTNIVVEMARENQTTAQGNRASKARMKYLEESIKKLGSSILEDEPISKDANLLRNDRLFLYYLQNGRDMYTGNELDINNLSSYDIDHIIPQSFVKDDSIDNRVLTTSSMNRGKSNTVPAESVVKKMRPTWERLLASGLISKKKFSYLTKATNGGLTEEDKAHFIQRQLVETRQITKNVAQILHQKYNNEQSSEKPVRVITLKSALASQFRKDFSLYKIRELNDYHHAQDAYLNGVIAQALLKVYPKLEPEFVYGEYQKVSIRALNKATAKKEFYSNIMNFFTSDEMVANEETGEVLWNRQRDIKTIKKVMNYHQMNIVKKVEIQTGAFTKESILPKGPSKKLIARKNNWAPVNYGGVDSPTVAYSVIITHEKGKAAKVVQQLVGIKILERQAFEQDEVAFLEEKGFIHPKVQLKLPKYSLYQFADGRRRLLASAEESQKGNQMVLPVHLIELLYHAKHVSDSSGKSLEYLNEHRHEFAELLEAILQFTEQYIDAEKNKKKVRDLYEKNQDTDMKELASSFIQLLQLNKQGAPADFKFFGETIPRRRYKNTAEIVDATFINQSITGLYETQRRLV